MKIVISGNFGAGNLGDEMILEGMLAMLKDVSPEAEITVLSANPKETADRYDLNSCRKVPSGFRSIFTKFGRFYSTTRKSIKNCDFFILGGGGLFTHLTLRANIIWAIQALAAQLYGKPVVMYGQSIGNIRSRFLRKLIARLFNKSLFIALRDQHSIDRLEKMGVTKEIHLIPDLAFRKTPVKHRKAKKEVLIALRQLKHLSPHFKSHFAEFLNWMLKNRSYRIKFIDFQRKEDRVLHNEIYDMLNNRSKVEFVGHPKYPEIHFEEAQFVVGMRLHSIISSIKTNTAFLAMNYAPKVEGLLDTIHLKEYLVSLVGVESKTLIKKFKHLEEQQEKIKEELEAYTKKALKVHHKIESKLKRLLKSSMEK
jgi:polysaccharide pyruvyl transferase CsaB